MAKLGQQPALPRMVHSGIEIAGKLFTQGHGVRVNHCGLGLIGDLPSRHEQPSRNNRVFSSDDIRRKASYLVQSTAAISRKTVGKKGGLDSKPVTRGKIADLGSRRIVEESR